MAFDDSLGGHAFGSVLAALGLALAPQSACAYPSSGVAVSLQKEEGRTVRVQVRTGAATEPALGWSGTAQPKPYRLVLVWKGDDIALNGPLPQIPTEGFGPVRVVALRHSAGETRLELQLDEAVQPSLRRDGDSWVLRLEQESAAAPPHPLLVATAAPPLARDLAPSASGSASAPYAPPAPAPKPARASAPAPAKSGAELLLVDMTVNGERLPGIARAERKADGAVLLAQNSWAEARLAAGGQAASLTDGTPAYALDTVAGLTYRVDRSALSLEINAPASAFVGSTLGPQGPAVVPPARPDPGVMLNYDVSLAHAGGGGQLTSGATVEAVTFGPLGDVVASGLLTDDGQRRTFRRLDTYWRYDMPERMETVVVGDTIGVDGGWSRPARYGGIRWGRDFGMRPGFIAMPQVSLTGEAALPSTVEVLVNNARRLSQSVSPGPFDLTGVPVVTGAGELNLVVRDVLGRETLVKQSYYASPRLLAPGLTDFSGEAGWLRTGYGQDSHYGDGFAAGTLRAGLTSAITGEARLEVQAARRAAGIEMAGLLGHWAVARAAVAASSGSAQSSGEHGQTVQLGLERSTPTAGGTLQYEYATRGFAPFGELAAPDAAAHRQRQSWLASIGGPLWGPVHGGLSYVRQTLWDDEDFASVGLFLSAPLGRRASVGFSLSKRLDDARRWTAGINVTLPLENNVFTAARVDRGPDGRMVGNVSAVANPPPGPGLGWRVEASTQETQRARGGLQYITNHAELAADAVTDAQGRVSLRAGARGTVGWLDGVPFASRPVGDGSFAVVEVQGMAGVPVKRSNQVVAETDAQGRAFVTGLLPWQNNNIEIDPTELPMDVEVGETTRQVVPHARSGTVVKFEARRLRQAMLVLHQADGQPVPLGTRVRLGEGDQEFIAGRRGEIWLTGLESGTQAAHVRWPAGGCDLQLEIPPAMDGIPGKLGPLVCAGGGS